MTDRLDDVYRIVEQTNKTVGSIDTRLSGEVSDMRRAVTDMAREVTSLAAELRAESSARKTAMSVLEEAMTEFPTKAELARDYMPRAEQNERRRAMFTRRQWTVGICATFVAMFPGWLTLLHHGLH